MEAISTESLRAHLQQRYLDSLKTNELTETVVAHNSDARGHKIFNLIYVLNYISEENAEGETRPSGVAVDPQGKASRVGILLGRKARGFGQGNWNGFGGKVDLGIDKSITRSAARELEEESGLKLVVSNNEEEIGSVCRHVGILFYQYPAEHQPLTFEVHKYVVDGSDTSKVVGEPVESEEMNPIRWFATDNIPLDHMWGDDPFWLPQLLEILSQDSKSEEKVSRITQNIDEAAFVGYVDFVTMTEVRGSTIIFGKDAVASFGQQILESEKRQLNINKKDPLRMFENTRCPIHE